MLIAELIFNSPLQNKNFMQRRGSLTNLKDALIVELHVKETVTMANVRCTQQLALNAEPAHRFHSNLQANVLYTAMIASEQRKVAIN